MIVVGVAAGRRVFVFAFSTFHYITAPQVASNTSRTAVLSKHHSNRARLELPRKNTFSNCHLQVPYALNRRW